MITYNALYGFDDVKEFLGISDSELWDLIHRNQLRYVMICERMVFRGIDLEEFVNHLSSF